MLGMCFLSLSESDLFFCRCSLEHTMGMLISVTVKQSRTVLCFPTTEAHTGVYRSQLRCQAHSVSSREQMVCRRQWSSSRCYYLYPSPDGNCLTRYVVPQVLILGGTGILKIAWSTLKCQVVGQNLKFGIAPCLFVSTELSYCNLFVFLNCLIDITLHHLFLRRSSSSAFNFQSKIFPIFLSISPRPSSVAQ